MDRREFVKAAVALAGTLGLSQALKAGTQAEKTIINHLVARGDMSDLDILQGAVAAEYKAIYAYGFALQSGLLKGEPKELAKIFRASHQGHEDTLSGAIRSMGGTPVQAQKQYDFGVKIATASDIAKLAYSLERGAAQAYLNAVDSLENAKLKDAAAQIMADEVLHATTWYKLVGHHPLGGYNQLPAKL